MIVKREGPDLTFDVGYLDELAKYVQLLMANAAELVKVEQLQGKGERQGWRVTYRNSGTKLSMEVRT